MPTLSDAASGAGLTIARRDFESIRRAITEAARRRIVNEHTYAHRAARILGTLKALR